MGRRQATPSAKYAEKDEVEEEEEEEEVRHFYQPPFQPHSIKNQILLPHLPIKYINY